MSGNEELRAERDTLASWLETVLWHMANPDRAGEGENFQDALRALYRVDPEAAERAAPGIDVLMRATTRLGSTLPFAPGEVVFYPGVGWQEP